MSERFPELVFGLVGAIGTDLELIQEALSDSLSGVGYVAVTVKLSDLAKELSPNWFQWPSRTDRDYYDKAMNGGNKLRDDLSRADAMAGLAIASIRRRRQKNQNAEEQDVKRAYILSSLKRTEEIDLLRNVYGASFFTISAYAPRATRVNRVASQLAERQSDNHLAAHRAMAEKLILRDENESLKFGQDVRKTFPRGDLFVNTSSPRECRGAVQRFVELIFGNPWKTPCLDEQGMAFAFLASLRSGSPARQVGAALTDGDGNMLSIGVNEVASPGGGQYWEGHKSDGRDVFYDSVDTSDRMRKNLLSDVLRRLGELMRAENEQKRASEKESSESITEDNADLMRFVESDSEASSSLRKSQLFDTIDFIRAVHAEASALFSAAGRTKGSTLYVTTFPCHECARHIVFCGVSRVVYVESYPKSLVQELYRDSISVDGDGSCSDRVQFVPFTGISPSIFQHLFSLTKKTRKEKDGTLKKWNAAESHPHLHISYTERAKDTTELEVLDVFKAQLKAKGISDDSIPRTA